MREILFRGKRKDTGEWIEGYYVKIKDYLTEKEIHAIIPNDTYLFPHGEFSDHEEVIPETVGRLVNNPGYSNYTNQRYFQGDIIKLCWRHFDHQDYRQIIGVVVDEHSFTERGLGRRFPQDVLEANVIGNVWDNPELLEV